MVRLVDPERRQARNFLARRQQWRLLMLILPMGIVIVLMMRLRDPKVADAINTFFSDEIKPRPAVAGGLVEANASEGGGELNRKRSGGANVGMPAGEAPVASPFPGINTETFGTIRDNSRFRNAEKDVWFHFFDVLRQAPAEELANVGPVPVDYVQLIDQPDSYRGKLVTMAGRIRQVTQQKPAENDLGIETYYRVILQPADELGRPVFIYCLELPPGLEEGENLSVDARVTGLFFKKLSYESDEGLNTAPVIVAKTIEKLPNGEASVTAPAAMPAATVGLSKDSAPSDNKDAEATEQMVPERATFQEVLELAGWDDERLAKFDEGPTLSDSQRIETLELLRRLRTFRSSELYDWATNIWPPSALADGNIVRNQLWRLQGRVTKVVRHVPTPADAERLEMPEYFECEFQADNLLGPVTVFASRVPRAWLTAKNLDEPAIADALFIKRDTNEEPERSIWLAKEIAWMPIFKHTPTSKSIDDMFREKPDPLFGKSVLLMDVGQLDLVEPRGKIRSRERDSFYEMLKAVGQVAPGTLQRIATDQLPHVLDDWQSRESDAKDAKSRRLAQEVVRRAEGGRYSVAPLFNDPENQIGRLFVFDGTARRAVRVAVEPAAMRERFGFDHYYELEVFTDDSQNFPLVFVVRELPKGFPIGSNISVPVRVAGFFFKDWLYRTRQPAGKTADGKDLPAERPQYAPLLVGRAPVVLATEPAGVGVVQYVAAGVFVLALAGVLAAVLIYSRGDRQFRETTLARNFSLPPGQSLKDLNVPAATEPMKE